MAVIIAVDSKRWYWALTTARSCSNAVARGTSPAGLICTKASNEFWRTYRAPRIEHPALKSQHQDEAVAAFHKRTFHLAIAEGQRVVGGYAVINGELCGLWTSLPGRGIGRWLLADAIRAGADRLDCYAGTAGFYAKAGFRTTIIERNRTPGGEAVHFMRRG